LQPRLERAARHQLGVTDGIGVAVLGQHDAVRHVRGPALERRRGGGVTDTEQRRGTQSGRQVWRAQEPIEQRVAVGVIAEREASLAAGFGEEWCAQ
jgi:hypothetical protein